jgi:hypothetical protein
MKRPLDSDNIAVNKWWQAARSVESDETSKKGVEILNIGTYLIRADDGLPFLGHTICRCVADGIPYKVLFFEETPELPRPSA